MGENKNIFVIPSEAGMFMVSEVTVVEIRKVAEGLDIKGLCSLIGQTIGAAGILIVRYNAEGGVRMAFGHDGSAEATEIFQRLEAGINAAIAKLHADAEAARAAAASQDN